MLVVQIKTVSFHLPIAEDFVINLFLQRKDRVYTYLQMVLAHVLYLV